MKTMRKNSLDEMQDRKLMKLEEYGFWIMFWALAVSAAVQLAAGGTLIQVAGELTALLAGSVFLCVSVLKNGIWTRKSTPTRKGSAAASLIPAVLAGALNIIRMVKNRNVNAASVLTAAAVAAGVYIGCFALLELFRAVYGKQRARLDGEEEESGE